ncbi:hypothetical protein BHE74_00049657 [Ensete ventricosum]|uniref:Uncharacterized protein n=1 Tax=Ensete ventricosum TaxID=4639 RepID=A0A444EI59_ENSVE|nr:hypothetical protein GW17_00026394 [Ensete ventricosum]RWW44568.1 hypothetical protein BHE74_00049657 [Ensete ventricosum]RZR74357.1 hypothetical protein BHM03_00035835 [Ensete ventricosum]
MGSKHGRIEIRFRIRVAGLKDFSFVGPERADRFEARPRGFVVVTLTWFHFFHAPSPSLVSLLTRSNSPEAALGIRTQLCYLRNLPPNSPPKACTRGCAGDGDEWLHSSSPRHFLWPLSRKSFFSHFFRR